MTGSNFGTATQAIDGRWLMRLGLAELVAAMAILSEEYGLDWAASWNDHLDDPDWLRRAMANTFMRLKPADKDLIRPLYEDWLWYEKNFDMKAMILPEYNALCFLLDKGGKRVSRMDGPDWLRRAMANTFMRLKPHDKDLVRPLYEDWLWYEKTFDMKGLVVPEFNALCYLLDKDGKRVKRMDGPVTVLRGLKGQDKREALETLDKKRYEFKEWW